MMVQHWVALDPDGSPETHEPIASSRPAAKDCPTCKGRRYGLMSATSVSQASAELQLFKPLVKLLHSHGALMDYIQTHTGHKT